MNKSFCLLPHIFLENSTHLKYTTLCLKVNHLDAYLASIPAAALFLLYISSLYATMAVVAFDKF